MFTRIMVPLDGSALAERALPCAAHIATTTGADIRLVRVVEPLPSSARSQVPANVCDTLVHDQVRAVRLYLDGVREQLATRGIAALAYPLIGDIGVSLVTFQRDAAIDLTVMCSRGRSGLTRFALGSVADHVLRHGIVPLALVRAFGTVANLDQAVVPLDGSAAAETALGVLAELAGAVVSHATLLRVIEQAAQGPEAEAYLADRRRRLERRGVICRARVMQGDPAEWIIATAGTDTLIVMGTRSRAGTARWISGSVADRVVRDSHATVLLLRAGIAGNRAGMN
jgi:nucleotide-binding universal stress UspA family protein